MLWRGANLSYFGQVALNDILTIETFFFQAGPRVDVNNDTYIITLFPGNKARFRELDANPLAYAKWSDEKGRTQIIVPSDRGQSNFTCNPNEFFPINMIIDQLSLLTDGRLMFWQYNELELRCYLPDVVESIIVY